MKTLKHLYNTQTETFSNSEYLTALEAEERNAQLRSAGSSNRWISDSSLEPGCDDIRTYATEL